MANNKASIKLTATLLPDDISKTLSNLTVNYQPADTTEGWYYQLSNITTSSTSLIADNNFIQKGVGVTSIAAGTGAASVSGGADKCKFLFIRHLGLQSDGTTGNAADSIYVTLDGTDAAYTETDSIEIGPNECWFAKLNCQANNIKVISDQKDRGSGTPQGTIQAQVFAIIDDAS